MSPSSRWPSRRPTAPSRSQKFYEPGVGTTPGERLSGGALGYGISRNICSCYRWLARNYQPEDRLFLFGFSRGAYTARSLAGLIRNCGILRNDDADRVDAAYAFYRDRTDRTHPWRSCGPPPAQPSKELILPGHASRIPGIVGARADDRMDHTAGVTSSAPGPLPDARQGPCLP